MLIKSFEVIIKELCEEILSEPNPEELPNKIIEHVKKTFPVEWSTLWLTEQKNALGDKRIKLKAAINEAKALLTAENGEPAIYDFGEGLTGYIATQKDPVNIKEKKDFDKYPHAYKYDRIMYKKEKAGDECRSVLGIPLLLKSSDTNEWRVTGVWKLENIIPSSEHPESYFTGDDVKIVWGYAAVIAVALEKAQMREDSIRIGKGLLEISERLLGELGEKPDLNNIVKKTAQTISAQYCSLWLRKGMQIHLNAAHGFNYNINNPPFFDLNLDNLDLKQKGFIVFVARTNQILNCKNRDQIINHEAFLNNNEIFKKDPTNSLVAIPLFNEETRDLKGVFMIENKRPTIFQLENYFTSEDQQLLTILGNSINLSLIIYERFERLKCLQLLVGNIRLLDGIEEALFFILTGLTHGGGLQYNRAVAFIKNNNNQELKCRFAIGPLDNDEWTEIVKNKPSFLSLDLDDLLKYFQRNKDSLFKTSIMKKFNEKTINLREFTKDPINKTIRIFSGTLEPESIFYNFSHGDIVIIPLIIEKVLIGVIYADNRFTGDRISQFELSVLDLFSGTAAAIIQASNEPDRLRKERDEAWRKLSQPAAHRLGTERTVIDHEMKLIVSDLLKDLEADVGINHDSIKKIKQSFSFINSSLERLRRATHDYQQLTPLRDIPSNIKLSHFIKEVVNKTVGEKENVVIDIREKDQNVYLKAREGDLKYVVEELILNSIKEIEVRNLEEIKLLIEIWKDNETVYCRYSDNGYDIPPQVKNHPDLFKDRIKGRPGGTGLGLLLMKDSLERNHGNIQLTLNKDKPKEYQGASFLITLPKGKEKKR